MKHMNPKIEKLLREGFSMKTLSSFNQKQIDVLFEKVTKKETKEQSTSVVNIPNSDAAAIADAKSKKQKFEIGRAHV